MWKNTGKMQGNNDFEALHGLPDSRPRKALYEVSAKIQIFTLKGGKCDKGHHVPLKYLIVLHFVSSQVLFHYILMAGKSN